MSAGKVYVIVHNVRSLHNVGSVFRTADGAGISKIFLTGYTPAPLDEMGRVRREIAKTALGAELNVEWEAVKNISTLIKKLKKAGVQIIALENTKGPIDPIDLVDYRTIRTKSTLVLVVGNEVRGLSKSILKKADAIVCIPMRGRKESLNVSVAFGIAAYMLTDTTKTK